jgi:hypothetical protein
MFGSCIMEIISILRAVILVCKINNIFGFKPFGASLKMTIKQDTLRFSSDLQMSK